MPSIADETNKWFKVAYADWPEENHWPAELLHSLNCPKFIPIALVKEHEKQVQLNHHQTIETINELGGLQPTELCAVLEDRPFRRMSSEDAVADLIGIVMAYQTKEWAKISSIPRGEETFRQLYEAHFVPDEATE